MQTYAIIVDFDGQIIHVKGASKTKFNLLLTEDVYHTMSITYKIYFLPGLVALHITHIQIFKILLSQILTSTKKNFLTDIASQ